MLFVTMQSILPEALLYAVLYSIALRGLLLLFFILKILLSGLVSVLLLTVADYFFPNLL